MTTVDFDKTDFFCPAPFVNLVQDHLGQCGPCPYIGGVWDLKDVDIRERWRSPRVDILRDKFLSGVRPTECSRCHLEDKVGMFSHRQHMIRRYSDAAKAILSGAYREGPRAIVLRLSNICNYACRTCRASDSSLYRREGKFYQDQFGISSRYTGESPVREISDDEMEQIADIAFNLEQLDFYGGEPLLNTSHRILLRRLIERGRAPFVSLFYCTNGSVFPDSELLEMWSHFNKYIQINFSIDAINEGYHLVRWPGTWENVSSVLHRYKTEARAVLGDKLSLGANLTISSLNIYNVPEIFGWLHDFLEVPPRTTLVHDPEYYSVRNIPDPVKEVITHRLTSHPHAEHFLGAVKFMNEAPCNESQWREFINWTEKKDAYRKVRFADVYGDYHRLLEPYKSAVSPHKSV